MNFHRTWHQDIGNTGADHLLANDRTEHFGIDDMCRRSVRIKATFEEKKSPSDCTYDGYGDNACICVRAAKRVERTRQT